MAGSKRLQHGRRMNLNGLREQPPTAQEIENWKRQGIEYDALVRRSEEQFTDLGALLRNGLPPVEFLPGLGKDVFYRSGVTLVSGHPEAGKSSFTRRCSLDYMEQGGHTLYFDWDNGDVETARSYHDIGASSELLSSQLHYMAFPDAPDWELVTDFWERWPDAFGIWDSLRGVMNVMGLNENEATDTARFLDPLVRCSLSWRVPMAVIDHVRKDANEKTGYGRGSGDKAAPVQGSWFVKKTKAFSDTEAGEIELTRWKARAGRMPPRHRFAVGDGHGNLTFERLEAGEGVGASAEVRIERSIIELVRREHPKTWAKGDLEEAVEGKARLIRAMIDALDANEDAPIALKKVPGFQHPRVVYLDDKDLADTDWYVDQG